MPIHMCSKHTWWKEVGPCMSYWPCWLHTIRAWLVSFKLCIPWVTWVWGINAHLYNVFHNLVFHKPTFLHFNCVHVMFCNCHCEYPHYPINSPTSKPFCFRRKPMFQWPMVRFHRCLCLLVWMWYLLKPHHSQI